MVRNLENTDTLYMKYLLPRSILEVEISSIMSLRKNQEDKISTRHQTEGARVHQ